MVAQPRFSEPAPSARPAEPAQDSAASLLTRLLNDVTALLRNEFALAKSELSDAAANTKRGVGGVAAGGVVLFAGLLALLAAAILGLSIVVAPWLAALIVGVVVAIIGFVMLKSAQKKLSPAAFRMERTQESLRRDTATIARRRP